MPKKPSLPGADALFGGAPKLPEKQDKRPQEVTPEPTPKAPKHVNKEESKPVNKESSKRVSMPKAQPESKRAGADQPQKDEPLVKYSLYFSEALLEQLDDVWFQLRKSKDHKVTKWKLVNVILEDALSDVERVKRLLLEQGKRA